MSNLLAMPLVHLSVLTGTNEDWIDSLKYVVGDEDGPQLDLNGIEFEMEVRRRADDHEVIIRASTEEQTLLIGAPPDVGYLLFNLGHGLMEAVVPGIYVADIVGRDGVNVRRVATIDLELAHGITRP